MCVILCECLIVYVILYTENWCVRDIIICSDHGLCTNTSVCLCACGCLVMCSKWSEQHLALMLARPLECRKAVFLCKFLMSYSSVNKDDVTLKHWLVPHLSSVLVKHKICCVLHHNTRQQVGASRWARDHILPLASYDGRVRCTPVWCVFMWRRSDAQLKTSILCVHYQWSSLKCHKIITTVFYSILWFLH